MACFDTTALVDISGRGGRAPCRAARDLVRRLRSRPEETLVTTRFNVAELLVGVARAQHRHVEVRRVRKVLRPLAVLEFDARAARAFGRIVGHLLDRGTPIGDMDALIASVCLVNGHPVVTRNVRHFERVPGLVVVSY